MVDHETEPLSLYRAAHCQYITGLEIRYLGNHRLKHIAPLQLEHIRSEEQGHIYAPGLGRIIVNYLITGRTHSLRRDQVLQHPAVLHLGETDDCRPGLVGSRNPVQYLGDIGQLLVILGLCPLLGAIGSKLLVPGRRVVVDVKEVLDIVECHDIALVLRPEGEECQKQHCGQNQFPRHI